MKCDCVRKELSAYIDGEVSSQRRTAIENHLAGCSDCEQYREHLSRLVESVREADRIEPSPEFRPATMRRIRALAKLPASAPAVATRLTPALAACVVVAIGVVAWIVVSTQGPTDEEMFTRFAIVAALDELLNAETLDQGSEEILSKLDETGLATLIDQTVSEELPVTLALSYSGETGTGIAAEEIVEALSSSEREELRSALLEMVKEG
jgi:hypothetical protein